MKRGRQFGDTAGTAGVTRPKGMDPRLDGEIDDERAGCRDGADLPREAVRETKPLGAFDARAIRELYKAAPTDPKGLRRTIRRSELRQIVPLADSTIYELERRGDFPRRFYLTSRCVVWDLAEVMAWIDARRKLIRPSERSKRQWPDVRLRGPRPMRGKP